jgi:hypothetical protein
MKNGHDKFAINIGQMTKLLHEKTKKFNSILLIVIYNQNINNLIMMNLSTMLVRR